MYIDIFGSYSPPLLPTERLRQTADHTRCHGVGVPHHGSNDGDSGATRRAHVQVRPRLNQVDETIEIIDRRQSATGHGPWAMGHGPRATGHGPRKAIGLDVS